MLFAPRFIRSAALALSVLALAATAPMAAAQATLIPTAADGATVSASAGGVACLGCSVAETGAVIDADLTNAARLRVPVGVAGEVRLTVHFGDEVSAPEQAGFAIGRPGGLADAALLGALRLTTYRGGSVQERAGAGTTLALDLLGSGGDERVGMATSLPFDAVQIEVGGVAAALLDLDVYYAFARTAGSGGTGGGGTGGSGQPLVVQDDDVTTLEDTEVAFRPQANDTDPDGQALAVTAVAGAQLGTVRLDGDLVVYSPDRDVEGTDVLTYTVSTSDGRTASGTVRVSIQPVNDAPSAPTIVTPGDGELVDLSAEVAVEVAWAPATDVDGDPLQYAVHLYGSAAPVAVALQTVDGGGELSVSIPAATLRAAVGVLGGYGPDGTATLYLAASASDGTEEVSSARVRLVAREGMGTGTEAGAVPFALTGVAPNPSAGPAVLLVDVPEPTTLVARVFDARGRQVLHLATPVAAGEGQQVELPGAGGLGAGVYVVRVELAGAGGHHATRTLTRVR